MRPLPYGTQYAAGVSLPERWGEIPMSCLKGQELHRIFEWAVADRISVQWIHASRTDPEFKEAQRREENALPGPNHPRLPNARSVGSTRRCRRHVAPGEISAFAKSSSSPRGGKVGCIFHSKAADSLDTHNITKSGLTRSAASCLALLQTEWRGNREVRSESAGSLYLTILAFQGEGPSNSDPNRTRGMDARWSAFPWPFHCLGEFLRHQIVFVLVRVDGLSK